LPNLELGVGSWELKKKFKLQISNYKLQNAEEVVSAWAICIILIGK